MLKQFSKIIISKRYTPVHAHSYTDITLKQRAKKDNSKFYLILKEENKEEAGNVLVGDCQGTHS